MHVNCAFLTSSNRLIIILVNHQVEALEPRVAISTVRIVCYLLVFCFGPQPFVGFARDSLLGQRSCWRGRGAFMKMASMASL